MRGIMMLVLASVTLLASLHAGAHGGQWYSGTRVGIGLSVGGPGYWGSWWGASRPYYYGHYSPAVVVVPRQPLVFYDERGRPVPNEVIMPMDAGAPLVFYDRHGRPVSQQAQEPAQSQPASATPTWLFCADSQSYYPYVQNCASAWQRVMPHPPPPVASQQ